jgi:hypothetical protein
MKTWYLKNLNGFHDQALIIDEETGRNIAVVYDQKDGPILAAAPDLFEALKEAYEALKMFDLDIVSKTMSQIYDAIQKVNS